ncbi:nucleoside phosphorylase domain-containing protein [Aspergillus aurantiobrunneus]
MNDYHLRYEDFTVGWVTALPIELAAARKMLDEEYEYHDDSTYTLGRIGEHSVVVACFPSRQLGHRKRGYSLEFCLMVGIGGRVPSPENDVRLGDVVVSQPQGTYGGVVQYDLGKTVSGGQQTRSGFLNAPPAAILKTVSWLQLNHTLGKDTMSAYLSYAGPDVLFESSYTHEGGSSVDCPQDLVVPRTPRTGSAVKIHYGTIASRNQVMTDAVTRDWLSSKLGGILCFKMEAARLMNNLPCLVIRGISDYCNSHKNASCQLFAAAVSAAYAKEVLALHPASSGLEQLLTPSMYSDIDPLAEMTP